MRNHDTGPPQTQKEWNNTQAGFSQALCLHHLFEAQVERTPQATAVIFQGRHLTYRELNQRANQLAHYLQSQGIGQSQGVVGPEVLVGLCLERSLDMVVGLLGTLKAGGAYVPLDPTYPTERLAFMLDNAQTPVLLTQQTVVAALPQYAGNTIYLDTDWPNISNQPDTNLQSDVAANNLAYVIYTSGSTGDPKGVMISHRAICNHMHWLQTTFPLTEHDIVLQKTPFSFDASIWEFYAPLFTGAQLLMALPEGHKDSGYLVDTIIQHNVTTLQTVPSLLQLLMDEPDFSACKSLRRVFCGGEALPATLVEKFQTHLSADLINLYGPTEASIDATFWPCPHEKKGQIIPIGRPIANMQAYILDDALRPVPTGETGELHLGGAGLSRGYLNSPHLTAEKFTPNPFSNTPGERLYKTGDLARYLPDGNIEFLGRADYQVKIHGFRIEPGEIEAVLEQHQAVKESVVTAQPDHFGTPQLVAYVIPENTPPTTSTLHQFLKSKLPDYMVPAAFVTLDAFPLTPNGKLDRQALPVPGSHRPELDKAYIAPQTKLELLLADMWQNVLGIDSIGIHDNFFELGGDSIKGAILFNKIQDSLREIAHVVVLFDAPTIAQLAAYFTQHYPEAVTKMWGIEPEQTSSTQPDERIDAAKIAQFRQIIPPLSPPFEGRGIEGGLSTKNPQAIFVLAPPRSGSTLLRVVLGGHPQLFSPPELELLSFDTLAERKDILSRRNSSLLEGTIRAIMHIKHCDVEQAQKIMHSLETQGLTIQQFYSVMQHWLTGQTLVDKTTTYALDPEILNRAEIYFEEPLYIHLWRHPYGMINSFEKARLDQFFFRYQHPFSAHELAELIWLVSHQNTLEFFKQIPNHRHHAVKFEDLVNQPKETVEGICQFLNLDFYPDMLQPYQDKKERMTDGLHSVSRMIGDLKFHHHKGISPDVADSWKQNYTADFLGDPSWQVAESAGYTRLQSGAADEGIESIEKLDRASTDDLLAQLDHLSNEELDALYDSMLAEEENRTE